MKRDIELKYDGTREYDPIPGRPKHRWKKNIAGFKVNGGHRIGKCPQDLKLSTANELIQESIADIPSRFDSNPYPKNLYVVFHGVIYRAVGGERTNVYHGFPCDKINELDSAILEKLRHLANLEGYSREFNRWIKDHA